MATIFVSNADIIRFMSKVDFFDKQKCWAWTGSKRNGYGRFKFKKKMHTAHRLSYEFTNGEFDSKLNVCHSCDNPSCVNPDHLWLGTHSDNMRDMSKKNRHPLYRKTHCKNGHALDGDNLKLYLDKRSGIKVRTCFECKKSQIEKRK